MTHTPGPWKFYDAYGSKHILFTRIGNYDETILEAARSGIETWIANEDDARLIAAAPEMLEALKAAETLLHKIHDTLASLDYATKDDTLNDILWDIDYYFEEHAAIATAEKEER